jgi:hypothetical protein
MDKRVALGKICDRPAKKTWPVHREARTAERAGATGSVDIAAGPSTRRLFLRQLPFVSRNPVHKSSDQINMLDLERLLRLRLVVARFGEMDVARWWNTKGQLGSMGAIALRRGFPRTHRFAQARSVFAVAAQRCTDLFNPPGCVTLWHLPAAIEEEFDTRWERWLDNAAEWAAFFDNLETLKGGDLASILRGFELVTDRDLEACSRLRRSAEGRAVPLPGLFSATDAHVALLALGFTRGEPGELAVPYMRNNGE